MGGENDDTGGETRVVPGSSPRGRGKLGLRINRTDQLRLIPAWAGKTALEAAQVVTSAAHPRVGGENCSMSKTNADLAGSSPRGRGKRFGQEEVAGV